MILNKRVSLLLVLAVCTAGCANQSVTAPSTFTRAGIRRLAGEVSNDLRQIALFYQQYDAAFLKPPAPGFPGFSDITASQSLAYTADLLETGVPVVYDYVSDIHGNHKIPALDASLG